MWRGVVWRHRSGVRRARGRVCAHLHFAFFRSNQYHTLSHAVCRNTPHTRPIQCVDYCPPQQPKGPSDTAQSSPLQHHTHSLWSTACAPDAAHIARTMADASWTIIEDWKNVARANETIVHATSSTRTAMLELSTLLPRARIASSAPARSSPTEMYL